MAKVQGEPGFTQIPRLNVTETLAIRGLFSGQTVLNAASFATQTPPGTDAPIQVEFGPATGDSTTPFELAADGTLTANQAGFYLITALFAFQRAASGGNALAFFRLLVNGVQLGNSVGINEDDNDSTTPLQFNVEVEVAEGDILTVEFYRDSAGANSGQLVPQTSALGWNQSASASVRVTKI